MEEIIENWVSLQLWPRGTKGIKRDERICVSMWEEGVFTEGKELAGHNVFAVVCYLG